VDLAQKVLDSDHQFQLSIEEQIATMLANGLAMSTPDPKLVVFATFAAFFEGIAREGMEMWRYQRNLNGANEGPQCHLPPLARRLLHRPRPLLGLVPRLDQPRHRLPALPRPLLRPRRRPRRLCRHPRPRLPQRRPHSRHPPRQPPHPDPARTRPTPLWNADSPWTDVTQLRAQPGAKKAILAFGATAFVAAEASDQLAAEGIAADAWVVNGLPLDPGRLAALFKQYPEGIVTIEDGLIGTPETGIRGFAGLVRGAAYGKKIPLVHLGIVDPRIAPSDGHLELWQYFGIDAPAAVAAVRSL
jgi:hypothetical protein